MISQHDNRDNNYVPNRFGGGGRGGGFRGRGRGGFRSFDRDDRDGGRPFRNYRDDDRGGGGGGWRGRGRDSYNDRRGGYRGGGFRKRG